MTLKAGRLGGMEEEGEVSRDRELSSQESESELLPFPEGEDSWRLLLLLFMLWWWWCM
jgi:hypothetical protein